MAVPTRPVQDAIIDPVWGQWVHDRLKGLVDYRVGVFRGAKDLSAASTPGFLEVTAVELGLTTIVGALAQVIEGSINGFYLCAPTVPSPDAVRITGVGVTSSGPGSVPTFQVWGTGGTLTIAVLAWGT